MRMRSFAPPLWKMVTSSRCLGLRDVPESNSAMPRIAFIGVRISWLIVARNWLLALFAYSAACLARSRSSFALWRKTTWPS